MTEKRFEFADDGLTIYDNENDDHIGFDHDLEDLLNEQHEQINTLRESRRELISANNKYRMRETELTQELSTLVDENEQLKQLLLQFYTEDEINAELI